jgi:hypothetical protein
MRRGGRTTDNKELIGGGEGIRGRVEKGKKRELQHNCFR